MGENNTPHNVYRLWGKIGPRDNCGCIINSSVNEMQPKDKQYQTYHQCIIVQDILQTPNNCRCLINLSLFISYNPKTHNYRCPNQLVIVYNTTQRHLITDALINLSLQKVLTMTHNCRCIINLFSYLIQSKYTQLQMHSLFVIKNL